MQSGTELSLAVALLLLLAASQWLVAPCAAESTPVPSYRKLVGNVQYMFGSRGPLAWLAATSRGHCDRRVGHRAIATGEDMLARGQPLPLPSRAEGHHEHRAGMTSSRGGATVSDTQARVGSLTSRGIVALFSLFRVVRVFPGSRATSTDARQASSPANPPRCGADRDDVIMRLLARVRSNGRGGGRHAHPAAGLVARGRQAPRSQQPLTANGGYWSG
jgi:hypothetical protein